MAQSRMVKHSEIRTSIDRMDAKTAGVPSLPLDENTEPEENSIMPLINKISSLEN